MKKYAHSPGSFKNVPKLGQMILTILKWILPPAARSIHFLNFYILKFCTEHQIRKQFPDSAMYAHNLCSVVSGPLTQYSYTSDCKSNQATKLGTTVIEQQQKGFQCTEIKQVTVPSWPMG